ncbi:hypothetical protein [Paractinoplanes lichenicola]|uniref:Uncharacterized protein n=1 Tax=Paractinoplanes lichenicola TaxID=2802976 RepID=A0ABS1VNN2_9ACTN|nr:hypothetical protein [Actinoplanes lichenicola]MBL7256358.1 hypothetical protein [Actinoplanes lichenicola]
MTTFILSVPLWTDDKNTGTDADWTTLARKIAAVDADGYPNAAARYRSTINALAS